MKYQKIISTLPLLGLIWEINAQAIQFSGYIGGTEFESIRDITTDNDGNIYVTGGTTSADYHVTAGAFQTNHNPGIPENSSISPFDVFVTKLDSSGNLIWSTFLGGPNYDRAYGIEVDSAGYVYVAGRAGKGFPVTAGSFQTSFQGGEEAAFYGPQDGFIAKITPDGSGLVWASFFGTSDARIVRDLVVDKSGNVYLASGYSSGTFVSNVSNKFLNAPRGGSDAVIAKIAFDGQSVIWAKYLGGTGWDSNENSVRVGPDEDPYFLFTTESSGIATSGAYDETYAGSQDFFINRLDNITGEILWGTYLGGSDNESTETHEFAVDNNGNAYVSGPTKSTDYPVTTDAFQSEFIGPAGFNDIVVSKISSDGQELLASTYIGGNGADRTEGIDVDDYERVFITGTTTSTNFPLTTDAYQTTINGGRDAIAVVVGADFKSLDYSSYIGSNGADYGRSADIDVAGNFLLAGDVPATGWPVVGNGEPFYGGTGDAMIAKFSSEPPTNLENMGDEISFSLFPNPGRDEMLIDLASNETNVYLQVYNFIGQLQWSKHFDELQILNLDTRNFPVGLYYILIQAGNINTIVLKWIRN